MLPRHILLYYYWRYQALIGCIIMMMNGLSFTLLKTISADLGLLAYFMVMNLPP